jgi:hypothetical protein
MLHLMQQPHTRTVVVTAAGGAGGGVSADGIWQWMGTLRLATSGWDYICRCSWSFFRASTQPKAGSYSGNLVADFSAGNGGAVDAVVTGQCRFRRKGNPNTDYVISFDGSTCGWGLFCGIFSELSGGGVSRLKSLLENHI